ncbi:beta-galactosidase [uncultured Robinsoniella sp.]|uniref:beta-galactosidase n=1 Tax=Robinsoniella sp. TaxID=2496533 RepID=UPI00374F6E3C
MGIGLKENDDIERKLQNESFSVIECGNIAGSQQYAVGVKMKRSILFPKVNEILHGGDYNPEQWLDRPDILEEDIRLMKKAGVNTVTLGVFSWSVYESSEGNYHFEWLDDVMDRLWENGIFTILATPSGARPAWLDQAMPQAMRVSQMGIRNRHGVRHNHCMTFPLYREKVREINTILAKRYGNHPGLILWHISNELGGVCYCDLCEKKFQDYLKRKYHDNIQELNQEWWTTFWSHRYNSFEQIEPPVPGGETSIHGLNLDWKRFTTWNMTDYMKDEIAVFKKWTPDIPVTTNFMRLYEGLDYHKMSKELDIISWDSYPDWHTDKGELIDTAAATAFDHSVMRSLKRDRPFMLMESVPSQVNWHPYNKLKRPGVHNLSCMQAVACGSDTVQYFQWRKSRGSYEQHHGAVIDHLGRCDTRIFGEVEEVGKKLKLLKEVQGSIPKASTAIIFDWENWWAINDMAGLSVEKNYPQECRRLYQILFCYGIEADIISQEEDLTPYKAVFAPMLYLLKPGTKERFSHFVEKGGYLAATYLTGYVNEHTLCYLGGFPGGGLKDVFGLYTEEIDSLYPSESNGAAFTEDSEMHGVCRIRDFCEIIKPLTARTLAYYTEDFYQGTPAITVNTFGAGKAWYLGARVEDSGLEQLVGKIMCELGITFKKLPHGVEKHIRYHDRVEYVFYLNYTTEEKEVCLGDDEKGFSLLYHKLVFGTLRLKGFGVDVIRQEKR